MQIVMTVRLVLHSSMTMTRDYALPIAFKGALYSSFSSMKLPGLMSLCKMRCEWHWESVRSTARMKLATCARSHGLL